MTDTNSPTKSNPPAPEPAKAVKEGVDEALETVRHDVKEVRAEAAEQLGHIGEEASKAFDHLKHEGEARLNEVKHGVEDYAAEQKQRAAAGLDTVATAIDSAADELGEDGDKAMIARYAHDLASGIRTVSSRVNERSVGDLVHDVEDFGRAQPAVFLGAAALLGFAASRFLSASSRRSDRSEAAGQTGGM